MLMVMHMEYTIVYGETMESLSNKVNQYISEGWQPQGGLVIEMGIMYQALVKGDK